MQSKSKQWRQEYLKALELPEDEKLDALRKMLESKDELPHPLPAFIETELEAMMEEDYKDNPGVLTLLKNQSIYIQNELDEASAQDVERVNLFNAILNQKPHDAKAAVDDLLKNKLSNVLDTYKSDIAQKIFNPQSQTPPGEKGEEEDPKPAIQEPPKTDEEAEPVDEMLRSAKKNTQELKTKSAVKEKK